MTRRRRVWSLLAVGLLAALPGCRLFERTKSTGGGSDDRPDPLLGGSRIPATNLPIPGKDGYGLEKRDPLLGAPAARDKDKAAKEEREPYRLRTVDTVAAMAGTPRDPGGLSIGDRRPAATPTGNGPVEFKPDASGGRSYDQIAAELRQFKADFDSPVKEGGEYVLRADVPIEGGPGGTVRRYEGAGATPAAAAKQVLDAVKGDRGLK